MKIEIKEKSITIPIETGQGDKTREKGVICSFSLQENHRETLNRIARDAGTTKAQVVRSAIEFLGRSHDA